jgi:hypothetical protein
VRFVTYTPKYNKCEWLAIWQVERTYERAVVDATRKGNTFTVTATNVRALILLGEQPGRAMQVTVNGQAVDTSARPLAPFIVENASGKWALIQSRDELVKRAGLQGPIDDAFTGTFVVVKPAGAGFHVAADKFASAAVDQFAGVWDRYFRGTLPTRTPDKVELNPAPRPPVRKPPTPGQPNVVLFGDPASNPLIAKVLPKLPITWTKEKLVVNGVEYDPKTHVPVLIYPNPFDPLHRYVVINSGHTFKESDLKGTNALLYPRLGDWAVIKPTPTDRDPAAYEVVAAGLFDENWQFPTQK